MGFSAEWAGDRNVRRDPFVEIEGPYSLPGLHDYQKTIVAQVRDMLRDVNGGPGQTTSGAATGTVLHAYEMQVRKVDPAWPVLVFATSVEHAQTIAALLSTRGVPSRAVSGTTEASTRRRIVEDFRRGDLKVLVNYGVFREGFDAPRTRVIIVARPVYSPNLYFQMIGRGLRGPENGGTDRCLIINVQDNIDNFERKLAFSDLDWLWA